MDEHLPLNRSEQAPIRATHTASVVAPRTLAQMGPVCVGLRLLLRHSLEGNKGPADDLLGPERVLEAELHQLGGGEQVLVGDRHLCVNKHSSAGRHWLQSACQCLLASGQK